jgi:hypothetical protein
VDFSEIPFSIEKVALRPIERRAEILEMDHGMVH